MRVKEHVQSEPWLQAESDASWELHGEDSGHLPGWERILDRAHLLLRPGPKYDLTGAQPEFLHCNVTFKARFSFIRNVSHSLGRVQQVTLSTS